MADHIENSSMSNRELAKAISDICDQISYTSITSVRETLHAHLKKLLEVQALRAKRLSTIKE
jgi:hypothetical protein